MGGGERHLADLSQGLVRRGHDVFVALRANAAVRSELQEIPNDKIFTVPLRNSLDVASARLLAKIVKQQQIQIVHAHMARDYPVASYAARGAKLIVTRHVLFPLNRMHRVTLSRAGRIVAVSQAVADQLVADGVAEAERIAVVHNGIDVEKLQHARKNFDRAWFMQWLDLPVHARLVGTVGELTPLKGQLEFLKAAAELRKAFSDLYFIIAGIDHSPRQENLRRIQETIAELKLESRVRLKDWIDDLPQLYCALDVFVSASHTESFGLAIAEAMASGTAVVATRTAGAQEIISEGETGVLVEIGHVEQLRDAIARLLRDAELRTRLGRAASQDMRRFSLSTMINKTERIYTEVLA